MRAMRDAVNVYLESRGIGTGTIVDAGIIHAPSSTKNTTETRDPEMHQTKKGNPWSEPRSLLQLSDRPPRSRMLNLLRRRKTPPACSGSRIAVPGKHAAKWHFPQENAAFRIPEKGT